MNRFTWKDALIDKINEFPGSTCYKDDQMAIIKDAYPKSRYHYLALPFDCHLNSLADLNGTHVNLISHMYTVSKNWITGQFNSKYGFKYGFHIRPSMNRLHLHLISNDHDSIYLYHHEQFNSFRDDFFIPPEKVIDDLKTHGKVNLPTPDEMEALLHRQLTCHFCDQPFDSLTNITQLKNHLQLHFDQMDNN